LCNHSLRFVGGNGVGMVGGIIGGRTSSLQLNVA
jgi:hypothetical protein